MMTSNDSIFDRKNKIRDRMNKELTVDNDAGKLMLMSSLLSFNENYRELFDSYKSVSRRNSRIHDYEARLIYNVNMAEKLLNTSSYCYENAFTSDDVKTIYALIWRNYKPMAYALRWLWMITNQHSIPMTYKMIMAEWASIDMAISLIQDYAPNFNPLRQYNGKNAQQYDLNMKNGSVALIGINAFADGTAMMINGYPVEFCRENVNAMTRDDDRQIIKDEDKMEAYVHEKEQLRDDYISKINPVLNEIKGKLSYNADNKLLMIDFKDDADISDSK